MEQELMHKSISEAESVHDYYRLLFSDGSTLNIFNQYGLIGVPEGILTGHVIAGVKLEADTTSIILSPFGVIRIGMTDADFSGPEAMEYISNNGSRVIWP